MGQSLIALDYLLSREVDHLPLSDVESRYYFNFERVTRAIQEDVNKIQFMNDSITVRCQKILNIFNPYSSSHRLFNAL